MAERRCTTRRTARAQCRGRSRGIAVAAAALLEISLVLGALVLVGLPPVLVAISLLGRPLVRRAASEQAEAAAATGVATDVVAGLRVLKILEAANRSLVDDGAAVKLEGYR